MKKRDNLGNLVIALCYIIIGIIIIVMALPEMLPVVKDFMVVVIELATEFLSGISPGVLALIGIVIVADGGHMLWDLFNKDEEE